MEGVPVRAAEGDTEEVGEREGLLAAEREARPGGGDSVPTGEGVSVAEAVGVADCVVEGVPPPPPPPPPALWVAAAEPLAAAVGDALLPALAEGAADSVAAGDRENEGVRQALPDREGDNEGL